MKSGARMAVRMDRLRNIGWQQNVKYLTPDNPSKPNLKFVKSAQHLKPLPRHSPI
jgi:hypothetical protein